MLQEIITVSELVFEEVEEILKLAELKLKNARPNNYYLQAQLTMEDCLKFEEETIALFQRARNRLNELNPAFRDTPQWKNLYGRAEQA